MSKDFTFEIGVSTTHYEGKCNEWGKLRYQTKEVTIDELGDYISDGYCFIVFRKRGCRVSLHPPPAAFRA